MSTNRIETSNNPNSQIAKTLSVSHLQHPNTTHRSKMNILTHKIPTQPHPIHSPRKHNHSKQLLDKKCTTYRTKFPHKLIQSIPHRNTSRSETLPFTASQNNSSIKSAQPNAENSHTSSSNPSTHRDTIKSETLEIEPNQENSKGFLPWRGCIRR